MADYTHDTYAEVDAELGKTADYATTRDVEKAKRRHAALTRKLDFVASSARDGQNFQFQQQVIERQLEKVEAFIEAHETPTEDERKANPTVLHADFSGFGPYGGRAAT